MIKALQQIRVAMRAKQHQAMLRVRDRAEVDHHLSRMVRYARWVWLGRRRGQAPLLPPAARGAAEDLAALPLSPDQLFGLAEEALRRGHIRMAATCRDVGRQLQAQTVH